MTTALATAVGAVIGALQAAPAVADQVHRSRLRPLQAGQATMLVVRPVEANADLEALAGQLVTWRTVIAVECYARATPGTAPDVAVDALLEGVHTRLALDPTLGGTVVALNPRKLSYDLDTDGEAVSCVVTLFEALHRAPAGAV